jgi:hypothetical protein
MIVAVKKPERFNDNMKKLFYILSIVLSLYGCAAQQTEEKYTVKDAQYLHKCQKELTDIIVHDIFTPPVASRVYVYPMLAAYEASRFADPNSTSITTKLKDFEAMPLPEEGKEYDFTIAAIKAFSESARSVVFSKARIKDFGDKLIKQLESRNSSEVVTRSIEFGASIAEVIVRRVNADNYKQTRGMERFEVKVQPGLWVPTPPDYADGVEPHWAKIKALTLDSSSQCRVDGPVAYSENKNDPFWKELTEVYEMVNTVKEDSEELNIAVFWDDNPFVSRHKGHLMFQDKKMTPGGHWLSICRIISTQKQADFITTARAYAFTSVALFDAFISCWELKYETNRVRPETVITQKIDKNWHPHLVTPPFPAYTSGHSTVSSAAAEMLTYIYGDGLAYTDSTELEYGLPIRSFTSFRQAAQEASMSRVYAGIHYRTDCDKGNEQGKKVAELVLSKIK